MGSRLRVIFWTSYYRIKLLRWPFLRKKDITFWGYDHLIYSFMIIGNHKMNVIEDGLSNYRPRRYRQSHRIRNLFSNTKRNICYSFEGDWCIKEYLTGLIPDSPVLKSPKVVIISMKDLWDRSTASKRQLILDAFGVEDTDIAALKEVKNILLTQPLSEDGLLSETEKIDLYKHLIRDNNIKDLLIKPHPRETTDYAKYFPECKVFTKTVPIELFQLVGTTFEKVYSINSTAAYNIANNSNAEVVMWEDKFPQRKK